MLSSLFGDPVILIYRVIAILIGMTLHEYAHSLAAYHLGDRSQKYSGRMSLNPLNHLDWVGLAFLLLLGFGWAKPVMVEQRNLKKPKPGMALTGLAGPAANLLTAFLFCIPFVFLELYLFKNQSNSFLNALAQVFDNLIFIIVLLNIGMALFNLIPIPPLDGSHVVSALLTPKARVAYYRHSRTAFLILIFFLCGIFDYILGMFSIKFSLSSYFSLAIFSIARWFIGLVYPLVSLFI